MSDVIVVIGAGSIGQAVARAEAMPGLGCDYNPRPRRAQ